MRELYYIFNFDFVPLINMSMPTFRRHHRVLDTNINPQLLDICKSIGIKPVAGAIFYSCPGFKTDICHVDIYVDDSKPWPSLAKLNYILGDKNTDTMWYEISDEGKSHTSRKSTVTSQPYQSYNLKYSTVVESQKLHGWHLFDAGVPHTVSNQTQNPKWTITFVMKDLITNKWLTLADCKDRLLKINT